MESFYTKVVGVTFENRQEKIQRLYFNGQLRPGSELILMRETFNNQDPNAIAVYTMSGEKIGYIGRDLAHTMAQNIQNGKNLYSAYVSQVTGGYVGGTYGVNIRVVSQCAGITGRNMSRVEYDEDPCPPTPEELYARRNMSQYDEDHYEEHVSFEEYLADNYDGNYDLFEANFPYDD
ncbi:MAG: HIRAN domain-containing protein [Clostridia bacterium]|nr:HIRAN domain-containing protein [Clostridia bacterium]